MSHLSFIAYFHLCELNTCQNHDFQNFMFMNHFCGLFVNVSFLSDYYYNIINKNQKDSENDCRIAVMFSLSQYLHLIQRDTNQLQICPVNADVCCMNIA